MLDISAHVPHQKLLARWIVPNSAAVRTSRWQAALLLAHFPFFIKRKNGIRRMINRTMEAPRHVGSFDQKIVDEQLTTHINRDDVGRIDQIGRSRQTLGEVRHLRWPLIGQFDPVVENFACLPCGSQQQKCWEERPGDESHRNLSAFI